MTRGRYIAGAAAIVLVTAMQPASLAEAARLKLVERKEIRIENGQVVPTATAKATGELEMLFMIAIDRANEQDVPPLEHMVQISMIHNFTIEPEGDERVGTLVSIDYSHQVAGEATVSGGAEALFGVGDLGTVTFGFEPIALAFGEPHRIVVNPAGVASTPFTFGPAVLSAGDPPLDEVRTGSFLAHIGDSVQAIFGGAVITTIPPGSSTQASLSGRMHMAVATTYVEVPALDPLGLGMLALALAAAAVLVLRRI